MTALNIYLAGPVAGNPVDSEISTYIFEAVASHGRVFTEHIFQGSRDAVLAYEDEWMQREILAGRSGNVYERDIHAWLDVSDCIVAIASPSFGTGFEVGYAVGERRIPALLLYPEGFPSKMATQNTHPLVTRGQYAVLEDINSIVAGFLAGVPQKVHDSGFLISFEGIEGCGKTTQIEKTRAYLHERGVPVTVAREPGGTSVGEAQRKLLKFPDETLTALNLPYEERSPEAEVFMLLTARAEFASKRTLPVLYRGEGFLADRYADATDAYQGGGRYASDPKMIRAIHQLNDFAIQGRWPDITFYLAIGYEKMLERLAQRNEPTDYFERLGRDFFERTIARYDAIAKESPHRVVRIDGKKTREAIFEDDIRPRLEAYVGSR